MRSHTPPRRWPAWVAGLLGAALFLAVAWPPSAQPLWFDEVFTANQVTFRNTPAGVVRRVAETDAHPPLHYLLLLGWSRLTGLWGQAMEGPPAGVETSLRASSTLTMAAAAGVAAAGGGPLSALLVAASPDAVVKAREARMYPLLGLLWAGVLLAVWRGRLHLAAWLGLLALYTQYLAPFLLLPALAWGVWQAWGRSGRRALLALWPLALFVPWLPAFLGQLSRGGSAPSLRPDPLIALEPFYRMTQPEALSLLLLGLTLLAAWRWRREPARASFVLLPFAGVLLWYLASLAVNTASGRYIGAFVPAMALAAGVAAAAYGPWVRAALGVALAAGALALRLAPPNPGLEDYRLQAAVLEHLDRRFGPGVLLGQERGRLLSLRYYYRGPTELRLASPGDLRDPPYGGRPFFLVQTFALGTRLRTADVTEPLFERARAEGRLVRLAEDEGTRLYAVLRSPRPGFSPAPR